MMLRVFAAVVSVSIVGGCALPNTYTAPNYLALHSKAESDPKSEAIVGMWHRQARADVPGSMVSILFQSNGMGIVKQNLAEPNWGLRPLEPLTFTYVYKGAGLWVDQHHNEYRISGGMLLRHAYSIFLDSDTYTEANIQDVFARVTN